MIDYYGTEYVPRDTYHASITFYGVDGWAWKSGYPTGMFYLKESSGAKLSTAEGVLGRNEELLEDPGISMASVRYALTADATYDYPTGIWTFRTSSAIPQSDSGRFYLVKKEDGTCAGEFMQVPGQFIDGNFRTTMSAIWVDENIMSGGDTIQCDKVFLMNFPLFYDKGIPNYDTSKPRVLLELLDSVTAMPDWQNVNARRCVPMHDYMKEVCTFVYSSGDALGEGVYLGRNQFIVPHNQSLNLSVGAYLYSDGKMWSGLNLVDSLEDVHYLHNNFTIDGTLVTMRNYISGGIPEDTEIKLYSGVDLLFTATRTDAGIKCNCTTAGQIMDIFRISTPSDGFEPDRLGAFIEYKVEGVDGDAGQGRGRVVDAKNTGNGVEFTVEPAIKGIDTNAVLVATIYVTTDSGSIGQLSDIARESDTTICATCDKYTGDIYTEGCMYIWDDGGNYTFARIGNYGGVAVLPLQYGVAYNRGEVVYDYVTGKLYECTGNCMLNDGDLLSKSDFFKIDLVTRAKTSYGKVYNKFMPYFGSVQALEYGEGVDYNAEMSVATRPLYITKIAENRLKYGWEHREFLNYGTMMNMGGRERNGSVDIFSIASSDKDRFETEWDVVTSTLDKKAKWHVTYPIISRGTESSIPVDVDNPVSIPANYAGGFWEVTVASAGHGLIEGCLIRVAGFGAEGELDINGYYAVHVVDGDTISFNVVGVDSTSTATRRYITKNENSSITYVGDYWMPVIGVSKMDDENEFQLTLTDVPRGIKHGDVLILVDLDADVAPAAGEIPAFSITVLPDGSADDRAITFACDEGSEQLVSQMGHAFQIRRKISDGDYVYVTGKATDASGNDRTVETVYRVGPGQWETKEINDIAVPSVIVSKQNIMDITETNPEFALGDELVIDELIGESADTAIVRLKDMIAHFTIDNETIINGRTMVYINNATPSIYNGWHTVLKVFSPKVFRIGVRFNEGECMDGNGLNGKDMTLKEGRWYAYTVGGVDWDKISNQVTFSLNNVITATEATTITTEREHGLAVGDFIVVGSYDDIVHVDSSNAAELGPKILCYQVAAVLSKYKVKLCDPVTGEPVGCSGLEERNVARGVKVTDRMDDIGSLRNEYTRTLETYGGKKYRFRKGDLVVALAQQNQAEVKTWRVAANAAWNPVRAKRTLKISALDVYSYRNGTFDGADVDADQDALKYETFSDVDVAGFNDVYVAGYRCVSKASFRMPSLDDMDTTRYAPSEYSSGEDFSNVSPRHEMKASFRGVPAMKYPLVEKIERLCYLRDAYVIDFDLIEYLARFLGYDITAMAADVNESSLYKTWRDRKNAIRETVATLPQYYALGGTKAGLHMLMSTFGIISDALTLWTDADHPYEEMIPQDTVRERLENGNGGKWVPTPYIDIVVTDNARYPQFSPSQSDIERIREQIRVFKPINVVFRDFVFRLVDTVSLKPTISMVSMTTHANMGVVRADCTDVEVDYLPKELAGCGL